MLGKHLTFHLFVFQLYIVVAILESVSTDQTVHCAIDQEGKLSCACLVYFVVFCSVSLVNRVLNRKLINFTNYFEIDHLVLL